MSSSETRAYMEFIHEAMEQAKLNDDNELFSCAYADAMLLANLERLFNRHPVDHPFE